MTTPTQLEIVGSCWEKLLERQKKSGNNSFVKADPIVIVYDSLREFGFDQGAARSLAVNLVRLLIQKDFLFVDRFSNNGSRRINSFKLKRLNNPNEAVISELRTAVEADKEDAVHGNGKDNRHEKIALRQASNETVVEDDQLKTEIAPPKKKVVMWFDLPNFEIACREIGIVLPLDEIIQWFTDHVGPIVRGTAFHHFLHQENVLRRFVRRKFRLITCVEVKSIRSRQNHKNHSSDAVDSIMDEEIKELHDIGDVHVLVCGDTDIKPVAGWLKRYGKAVYRVMVDKEKNKVCIDSCPIDDDELPDFYHILPNTKNR